MRYILFKYHLFISSSILFLKKSGLEAFVQIMELGISQTAMATQLGQNQVSSL